MAFIYLSIGSNTGDRDHNIILTLNAIEQQIGKLISVSGIYETQSWGYEGQNFLNMAVKVQTERDAFQILSIIRDIETNAGRKRTPGRYTDRPADIDILFMDDQIIQSESLVVPHPRLQDRLFVLVPMMDVDADFIHPLLKKTIRQLRQECRDTGWIKFHSAMMEGL